MTPPTSLSPAAQPLGDTRLPGWKPTSIEPPALTIPHDCEPETLPKPPDPSSNRFLGVDVARALALFGMIAVHVLSAVGVDGTMSLSFVLSAGKSSALFALVAGIGIAFATGGTKRPQGQNWISAMAGVIVRAVLIAVIGLMLGSLIPAERADIILISYALMFLLAVPLLRLRASTLAIAAGVSAIGMPILSHILRQDLEVWTVVNPTFGMLAEEPGVVFRDVLLTGPYPALCWIAYICAGMAVGRTDLARRGAILRITLIGGFLAIGASVASWFLLHRMGGMSALATTATDSMSREDFVDTLVWGAEGVLPVNTPWWLAVLAPHTSTPVDILFTMGIALAALGVALTFALVAPGPLRPLGKVGSMPLTIYVLHLLLLVIPWMPEVGVGVFVLHIILLGAFAILWTRFFKRGPLEQGLWWLSHHARRFVQGIEIATPVARPKRAAAGRPKAAVGKPKTAVSTPKRAAVS